MLPISLQTGDPVKGWEAELTWVFVQVSDTLRPAGVNAKALDVVHGAFKVAGRVR